MLLRTKYIPNKINETVDFSKENLMTVAEIAIRKNHFPMVEKSPPNQLFFVRSQ